MASIAGATLGYITAGLPGAYVGYRTGKFFAKNNSSMALKRKRSAKRTSRKRAKRNVTYKKRSAPNSRTRKRINRKKIASKRRSQLQVAVDQLHQEKWFHTFSKKRYKTLGSYTFVDLHDIILNGNKGIQSAFELKNFFTRWQLTGNFCNDSDRNAKTWRWSPWNFLLNKGGTGSMKWNSTVPVEHPNEGALDGNDPALPPDQEAATDKDRLRYYEQFLFLQSADTNMQITNLQTATVNVKILWCLAKKDGNIGPLDAWTHGLQARQKGITTISQNQGNLTGQTFPGNLGTDIYQYGADSNALAYSDPRAVKEFNHLWKVLKVHKFTLEPGGTHHIKCMWKMNRLLSFSKLEAVSSVQQGWEGTTNMYNIAHLAGYTIIPVVLMQGAPIYYQVKETDGLARSTEGMTYADGKLGVLTQSKYVFKPVDTTGWSASHAQSGIIQNNIVPPSGSTVVYRTITTTQAVEDLQEADDAPMNN